MFVEVTAVELHWCPCVSNVPGLCLRLVYMTSLAVHKLDATHLTLTRDV